MRLWDINMKTCTSTNNWSIDAIGDDLNYVEHYDDWIQLERFSLFHQLWSDMKNEIKISSNYPQNWQRWWYQGKTVNTWICGVLWVNELSNCLTNFHLWCWKIYCKSQTNFLRLPPWQVFTLAHQTKNYSTLQIAQKMHWKVWLKFQIYSFSVINITLKYQNQINYINQWT